MVAISVQGDRDIGVAIKVENAFAFTPAAIRVSASSGAALRWREVGGLPTRLDRAFLQE
jgi:hypothetical protein